MSALPPSKTALVPFAELQQISKAISPQLFSLKNDAEVFTLMMLGQADGIHPITALRRYHIISGKPAMKAEAMLACFLEAGGKVKWLQRTDEVVEAQFFDAEEDKNPVTIKWDKARVTKARLAGNHLTYPCQMMTARVISEGVRLKKPQIVIGIYTPEEVSTFTETVTPGPNESTWGNTPPPAPEQPKQVEASVRPATPPPAPKQEVQGNTYDEVTNWIVSQFDPEKWQRSDWSMHYPNYRDDVIERAKALPEHTVKELRGKAYYHWLSCMICTADQSELSDGTWEGKVNDSGLPLPRKQELHQLIMKNREAFANAA